jgi:hypothetical protein
VGIVWYHRRSHGQLLALSFKVTVTSHPAHQHSSRQTCAQNIRILAIFALARSRHTRARFRCPAAEPRVSEAASAHVAAHEDDNTENDEDEVFFGAVGESERSKAARARGSRRRTVLVSTATVCPVPTSSSSPLSSLVHSPPRYYKPLTTLQPCAIRQIATTMEGLCNKRPEYAAVVIQVCCSHDWPGHSALAPFKPLPRM